MKCRARLPYGVPESGLEPDLLRRRQVPDVVHDSAVDQGLDPAHLGPLQYARLDHDLLPDGQFCRQEAELQEVGGPGGRGVRSRAQAADELAVQLVYHDRRIVREEEGSEAALRQDVCLVDMHLPCHRDGRVGVPPQSSA